MELIGKQKLIEDIYNSLRAYYLNDTRVLADIMDTIRKEETIINLHGEFEYGMVLAPCPRCGSFEILVNATLNKGLSNEYHKFYTVKFTCANCGRISGLHVQRVSDAYREWNRSYVKSKIGQ